MNEKAIRTLEYSKIINRLADLAGSVLGAQKCRETMPLTELTEIEKRQRETSDALARLLQKGSASFSGIPDVRASIKRLEVDATLGAGELLKISSLLTATLRLKNYGNKEKEKAVSHQPEWKQELERQKAKQAEEAAKSAKAATAQESQAEDDESDSLTELFNGLEPLSSLNNEIKRCILSEEEIADDASPGLKSVRRAIKSANDKIREQLGSLINSQSTRGMMQDALITMRNGRY